MVIAEEAGIGDGFHLNPAFCHKNIGRIVREFRRNLPGNVTQEQFGKRVGVPASVISVLETGKRTLSKQVALRLHQLTGLFIETFIGDERKC